MKYFRLVWSGLARRPIRSGLTVISVAVAFVLFGALLAVTSGVDSMLDSMSATRLRVQNRSGLFAGLPLSYLEQIKRLPGVRDATFVTVFPAHYQEERNAIGAVALDVPSLARTLPPAIKVSKQTLDLLQRTRTGAVVGAGLAARYNWKVGDRVPLYAELWPMRSGSEVWTFDIVGTYDTGGEALIAEEFWFNFAFLDDSRPFGNGTVHMYEVVTDSEGKMPAVAAAIDGLFVNSANATVTQSDREWFRDRLKRFGDFRFLINIVVGAALFALVFVISNTMMQSVRERIPELSVLKAMGYSDGLIAGLIVTEASMLCIPGAVLGLAAAYALSALVAEILQLGQLTSVVVIAGVVVALLLAIASTVMPALQIKRLSVAQTIARR